MREEFVECQSDVLGNLSQQYRRNVPPLVIGNRGDFPSRIAELLVRTTLPHRDKANLKQNRDDFAGLENWDVAHRSGYRDVLNADKLSFKNRIAIFKQHCDNLLEVALQFIEGFGLRMRAIESRNKAYVESSLRTALDYCGVISHLNLHLFSYSAVRRNPIGLSMAISLLRVTVSVVSDALCEPKILVRR